MRGVCTFPHEILLSITKVMNDFTHSEIREHHHADHLIGHLNCSVLVYVTLCPFQFCNHLNGEERAGCFAWFAFLSSPGSLPRGAMGLSAVCDCDIF